MKQQSEIQDIIHLISFWITEIKIHNAITFYDINKVSEDLACKLLNEIYDYELINLNIEKKNFPGIDLGDKVKSLIAFQVTSMIDNAKIRDSIRRFVNNGYDDIYKNGIRFLILSQERGKFGKLKTEEIYSSFNKEKHIITANTLIDSISNIYNTDYDKFKSVKQILEFELQSQNTKNKSDWDNEKPHEWVRRVWPKKL